MEIPREQGFKFFSFDPNAVPPDVDNIKSKVQSTKYDDIAYLAGSLLQRPFHVWMAQKIWNVKVRHLFGGPEVSYLDAYSVMGLVLILSFGWRKAARHADTNYDRTIQVNKDMKDKRS